MTSFFSSMKSALSAPIGNMKNSNADDIIQTRRNFAQIGRYTGETEIGVIDRTLDQTIKIFQRGKGLKVDGIMNPEGETERALNRELLNAQGSLPKTAARLELSAPVGNNRTNQKDDVMQVQRGLGALGFVSEKKLYEPSGILDRETVDSLQLFQKNKNLRVDGFLNPGGETEIAINNSLHHLAAPPAEKGDDEGGNGDNEKENPPSPPPEDGGDNEEKENPKATDCSDLEIEWVNAEAAYFTVEQKLEKAQGELSELEDKLIELEEQLDKEKSYIYGDKGKARNIGAAIGAGLGGFIAKLPGAVAGMGVGSQAGILLEEGLDYATGKKTDYQLKVEIAQVKNEIKTLEEEIVKLTPEAEKLKKESEEAKQAYADCKNSNKGEE